MKNDRFKFGETEFRLVDNGTSRGISADWKNAHVLTMPFKIAIDNHVPHVHKPDWREVEGLIDRLTPLPSTQSSDNDNTLRIDDDDKYALYQAVQDQLLRGREHFSRFDYHDVDVVFNAMALTDVPRDVQMRIVGRERTPHDKEHKKTCEVRSRLQGILQRSTQFMVSELKRLDCA